MVLVSIKTMMIIDIEIFCLWPIFSIWVFESMWAPRNQSPTCIAYLKDMARLRVLVSPTMLRIIATSSCKCTVDAHGIKKKRKRDF
ncbi:MAG: hypothetical protein CL967_06570 [Euryarchaeota archaeon]|nr:hypothetical protein [Euryarchaeota archaeon]